MGCRAGHRAFGVGPVDSPTEPPANRRADPTPTDYKAAPPRSQPLLPVVLVSPTYSPLRLPWSPPRTFSGFRPPSPGSSPPVCTRFHVSPLPFLVSRRPDSLLSPPSPPAMSSLFPCASSSPPPPLTPRPLPCPFRSKDSAQFQRGNCTACLLRSVRTSAGQQHKRDKCVSARIKRMSQKRAPGGISMAHAEAT